MEQVTKRLEVKHIKKTFLSSKGEPFEAIHDVSFDVRDCEFLVLLGPGLCGKTVLLNIIAGLLEADSGTVLLDDKPMTGCSDKISMVFQKMGLFSWMTVLDNVEVGVKYTGIARNERRERAQHFIELVGLNGFEHAYPSQLSGGMKQRVGIARAYTANPEILILDEPFGQLDAQTRYAMEDEILRIWESEKKTVIFVTNNIEEAVYLGDRIILLEKCPTRVKEIYDITLPRPRNMMDDDFLQLRTMISDNMELSV